MINITELSFKDFSFGGINEPEQKMAITYTSSSGDLQQGVWECGPGELSLKFDWDETIFVLEGMATVENLETGEKRELIAGALSVFEKNSSWVWRIPCRLRKVFTIKES